MFQTLIVPQEAELTILYNFYIDCMPSDDMAEASPFFLRPAGGKVGVLLPCIVEVAPTRDSSVSSGCVRHLLNHRGGKRVMAKPWREHSQWCRSAVRLGQYKRRYI